MRVSQRTDVIKVDMEQVEHITTCNQKPRDNSVKYNHEVSYFTAALFDEH